MNSTKSLILTLGIIFASIAATYLLLSALSVPAEFAKSAAAIWGTAMPSLYKILRRFPKKRRIISLSEYALPWPVVLCSTILLAAAAVHAPMLIGLLQDEPETSTKWFLMCSAIPAQLVLFYLVARWIGVRSGTSGVWFVMAACVVGTLISGGSPSIPVLAFWALIAGVGFWRGRSIRLRHYAGYLLQQIPAENRHTVLDKLRDEVRGVRGQPIADSASEEMAYG